MVTISERNRRSVFSWIGLARIGASAIFLFWFYTIWNTTTELHQKLNTTTNRYSAIHDLQVTYKIEIQEWKNLLLRSNSTETLDNNWRIFEAQYRNVASPAEDIIRENDLRSVTEPMKAFVGAHAANYEQYKKGIEVLAKRGFDPRQADAVVKGIDRPLLDYLEAAGVAMQEEEARINDGLTARAGNQIELSLLLLTFVALLVVWMPKW